MRLTRRHTLISLSAIVSKNKINPIMQRAKIYRSVWRALPVYYNGKNLCSAFCVRFNKSQGCFILHVYTIIRLNLSKRMKIMHNNSNCIGLIPTLRLDLQIYSIPMFTLQKRCYHSQVLRVTLQQDWEITCTCAGGFVHFVANKMWYFSVSGSGQLCIFYIRGFLLCL